jgi:hypothetical protein
VNDRAAVVWGVGSTGKVLARELLAGDLGLSEGEDFVAVA